jgi:hypothetical protein
MRDAPYVAYAFSFTVLFALAFSTVANFGLLARQRSMALPLLALLLSIPPGSERSPATSPPGSPDAIRR